MNLVRVRLCGYRPINGSTSRMYLLACGHTKYVCPSPRNFKRRFASSTICYPCTHKRREDALL